MKTRVINKLWRKALESGELPRNWPFVARLGLRNSLRRARATAVGKGWHSNPKGFQRDLEYFLRYR